MAISETEPVLAERDLALQTSDAADQSLRDFIEGRGRLIIGRPVEHLSAWLINIAVEDLDDPIVIPKVVGSLAFRLVEDDMMAELIRVSSRSEYLNLENLHARLEERLLSHSQRMLRPVETEITGTRIYREDGRRSLGHIGLYTYPTLQEERIKAQKAVDDILGLRTRWPRKRKLPPLPIARLENIGRRVNTARLTDNLKRPLPNSPDGSPPPITLEGVAPIVTL